MRCGFSEPSGEEYPEPHGTESVQGPRGPALKIRLHPRLDEIVADARRHGLKYKDGEFVKAD